MFTSSYRLAAPLLLIVVAFFLIARRASNEAPADRITLTQRYESLRLLYANERERLRALETRLQAASEALERALVLNDFGDAFRQPQRAANESAARTSSNATDLLMSEREQRPVSATAAASFANSIAYFAAQDLSSDQLRRCRAIGGVVKCIQRAPTLSVVIPFPPKQLDAVLTNLRTWSVYEFYPCERAKRFAPFIDLVFYMSRDDAFVRDQLTREVRNATWRRECFNRVYFKLLGVAREEDVDQRRVSVSDDDDASAPASASAPLRALDASVRSDRYGTGTLSMFYGMFARRFFYEPRDYALWMEPDLCPLRPLWLDKLYEDEIARAPGQFWVKGSIPRYPFSDGDWHMNGNALYAVSDAAFAQFVRASRGAFKPYLSFDQSLFAHFQRNPRPVAHFFQYTDTIQNRGYEIYSIDELREQEPRCFLAHGKGIVESKQRFLRGKKQ